MGDDPVSPGSQRRAAADLVDAQLGGDAVRRRVDDLGANADVDIDDMPASKVRLPEHAAEAEGRDRKVPGLPH